MIGALCREYFLQLLKSGDFVTDPFSGSLFMRNNNDSSIMIPYPRMALLAAAILQTEISITYNYYIITCSLYAVKVFRFAARDASLQPF